MGNVIVAQSGGPTVAINASLVGVMRGVYASDKYEKIYGALHGISGVMKEDLIDLTDRVDDTDLILSTPASYLGSCRYKMPDAAEDTSVYEDIFRIFEKYDISAVFYIGGNDSMDTIDKLARYGSLVGSSICFAGVPKTIDNDLVGTDHTPGFGSAAKYIAATMLEIGHDTAVYQSPCVTIVEIMGRNAGWLTASAALARNDYNPTPQLIYLPEVTFDIDVFLKDLRTVLESTNNVVVAVSEGLRDTEGQYLTAKTATNDRFGHAQLSGVGKYLEGLVKRELGIKCRSVELNILQRCAAHIASEEDLAESEKLGEMAVRFTEQGNTGFMSAVHRISDQPYTYEVVMSELSQIANQEQTVPRQWINEAGNDVTEEMIRYISPLIQGEVIVGYNNGLPIYADIGHLTNVR